MSERYKGFVVALDRDIREDDAEAVLTALRMVKGVAAVRPVAAEADDQIVEMRVTREIKRKLYEAVDAL